MRTSVCLGALSLSLISAPVMAQDRSETPTIIVTGEGSSEANPDLFVVDAGVHGQGPSQTAALRQLAEAQARLLHEWPRLDGLMEARVTTGNITIEPRRDPDCENNARNDEGCPVLGYMAYSGVILTGAPAERAGDAVSLASDLGATTARLDEYVLSDRGALRERANRAAFEDARRQAELLADASGRRLGRIVRIQDPSAARYNAADEASQIEEVVVVGSRARPAVSIEAAPEPVRVEARITVVFEIE